MYIDNVLLSICEIKENPTGNSLPKEAYEFFEILRFFKDLKEDFLKISKIFWIFKIFPKILKFFQRFFRCL